MGHSIGFLWILSDAGITGEAAEKVAKRAVEICNIPEMHIHEENYVKIWLKSDMKRLKKNEE